MLVPGRNTFQQLGSLQVYCSRCAHEHACGVAGRADIKEGSCHNSHSCRGRWSRVGWGLGASTSLHTGKERSFEL